MNTSPTPNHLHVKQYQATPVKGWLGRLFCSLVSSSGGKGLRVINLGQPDIRRRDSRTPGCCLRPLGLCRTIRPWNRSSDICLDSRAQASSSTASSAGYVPASFRWNRSDPERSGFHRRSGRPGASCNSSLVCISLFERIPTEDPASGVSLSHLHFTCKSLTWYLLPRYESTVSRSGIPSA